MAQPWANAGTVPRVRTRNKSGSHGFLALGPAEFRPRRLLSVDPSIDLLHSQPEDTPCIRKEKQIHDDKTRHHRDGQRPAHDCAFELKMHEVGNDQRRLDDRKSQQNLEHSHRLEYLLVAEPDFHCGQNQQCSPNPEILAFAVVMRRGVVHLE